MNNKISILKSGNVYFFYRPKIRKEEEIQRFFFVLSDEKESYTSLIVGKKHLPEDARDRYFLFVEETNKRKQELLNHLQGKYHKSGKRETTDPESRCLAEGKFIIADHDGHTHFIYQITSPEQIKGIQQEFNLKKEDDYLIVVKNPEFGTMLSQKEKIKYPSHLQEKFGSNKFIPLDPEFLNYKGAEFLLVNKKSKNLTEKEEELKDCLKQINQKDLTKEFIKILSPKGVFPLQ